MAVTLIETTLTKGSSGSSHGYDLNVGFGSLSDTSFSDLPDTLYVTIDGGVPIKLTRTLDDRWSNGSAGDTFSDYTNGTSLEIKVYSEAFPIIIMDLDLTGAPAGRIIRFTTAPHNVIYEGYEYTAYGDLLQISDIQETGEITSEGIEIQLSGVDVTYQSELDNNGFRDAPIDLRLAELPNTTNIIPDGTAIWYHRGIADTPRQSIDYRSGTITLVVETRTVLGDLDRIPDLTRCSQSQHGALHGGSLFFQYVASADINPEETWIS
jgi:hypothetical protein